MSAKKKTDSLITVPRIQQTLARIWRDLQTLELLKKSELELAFKVDGRQIDHYPLEKVVLGPKSHRYRLRDAAEFAEGRTVR